jgi:hypothetical protein
VTVTGQDPTVVREPTFQVQLTPPEPLAVLGPRPAAWEGPDLYSTTIVHEALPRVWAAIVAKAPREIGEVRLVIRTVRAPDPALGRGVGRGVGPTGGAVP